MNTLSVDAIMLLFFPNCVNVLMKLRQKFLIWGKKTNKKKNYKCIFHSDVSIVCLPFPPKF